MAYLSRSQIQQMGFKYIGENVLISNRSAIYDAERIVLHENTRIDDFCLLSGMLEIGSFTHLAPYTMLAGGLGGIHIGKYVTFAYGVKVFSESDDYTGDSLVGSLIPRHLKHGLTVNNILIQDYCILGTNSTLMPGAELGEGVALGAHSLVKKSLSPWGIYCGNPATWLCARSKNVKEKFLNHCSARPEN